jgi:hypothetical protein
MGFCATTCWTPKVEAMTGRLSCRNNFGGTIGGPIVKNRAFFFVNMDGLRQLQANTIARSVGLPAWRTGDFSAAARQVGNQAVPVVLYDPNPGRGTSFSPAANTPFPGNVIPAVRLDPVALKAVSFVPAVNRAPDNPFDQQSNWQANEPILDRHDYYTIRVDHNWSDRTKMFARYLGVTPDKQVVPPLPGWGPAASLANATLDHHQNLALNLTRLFFANLFHDCQRRLQPDLPLRPNVLSAIRPAPFRVSTRRGSSISIRCWQRTSPWVSVGTLNSVGRRFAA